MRSLYAKAALVCATTAVGVTMFAGVAFAAPTLPAGKTSGGPHDSRGNCASCHSYAAPKTTTPAAPTAPAVTAPAAGSQSSVTVPAGSGSYTIIINISPSGTPAVTAQPVAPLPADTQAVGQSDGDDNDDD